VTLKAGTKTEFFYYTETTMSSGTPGSSTSSSSEIASSSEYEGPINGHLVYAFFFYFLTITDIFSGNLGHVIVGSPVHLIY